MEEGVNLDSFPPHLFEEGLFDAAASDVVVEDSDLNPFPCFGDQGIPEMLPGPVVAEDVVLEVDMVFGPGDFIEQGLHFGRPVGVWGDPAAVERHGVDRAFEELCEGFPGFGNFGVSGLIGFDEVHGDPFPGSSGDDSLFGEVLSEEEVEEEPDHGREDEHDDPGEGLQRVSVFGDDDQDDAEDRHRIECDEDVCQNLLHTLLRLPCLLPPPSGCYLDCSGKWIV